VTIRASDDKDLPTDFSIEKVAMYDPYTYDSNPKGKQVHFKNMKKSLDQNSKVQYSIQLPNVHSRRSIKVELTGDMKTVKALNLSYKEYSTDVKEKKQSIAMPEKTLKNHLMNLV